VPDLLEIAAFLDDASLTRIRDEMRAAAGDPATVTGVEPELRVASPARRATEVGVSEVTREEVAALLEGERLRLAVHFERPLHECERPQFLRYEPGDYFVAHQDGNTPLVHDESRFRKVSVVIFLSEPGTEYAGGALHVHGAGELAPAPGTLVAFPSETTHEVTPITEGERLSIVSWYRGDEA
jgi:SM-20-related protein